MSRFVAERHPAALSGPLPSLAKATRLFRRLLEFGEGAVRVLALATEGDDVRILLERQVEALPDVDERLDEMGDMRIRMERRRRDAQPLAAALDRRIIDRLDINPVAIEQPIARQLAALRVADFHRH